MKKMAMMLSIVLLTFGLSMPVWAENDMAHKPETKVELTKEQQKELAEIHQSILEKKLEMIDKHVEFGVISKEKGDKIKEKLQMKFEKMKENGYMPGCHSKKERE